MIRPMLRPMIRPMIRTMIGGLSGAIKKVFINLESTASAHYSLASPVTFAGDFEIEVDFVTTNSASFQVLASGTLNVTDTIVLSVNGTVGTVRAVTYVGGVAQSVLDTTSAINDGKLHTIKLSVVGTVVKLFSDGAEEDGAAWNLDGNQDISLIGKRGGGTEYFNGIISNVKLTDITTPANSLSFGLDELTADFELPAQNVFGSELGGIVSEGAGWTDNGGGSYDWASGSNATTFFVGTGSVVAGALYQVDFTVSNYVGSGDFGVSSTTTTEFAKTRISGNGTVSAVIPIDGSNQTRIAFFARSTQTLTISNISVREVTNALTYENIATTTDVRDTYTLVDGDWLGSELIVNGDFTTDSDWSGVNWAISGGTVNASAATVNVVQGGLPLGTGMSFATEFKISNFTSGEARLRFAGAANSTGTIRESNGVYVETIVSTAANNIIAVNPPSAFTGSIDNVSVKRLIEVAP